jgi:mannose-binding lectin 2
MAMLGDGKTEYDLGNDGKANSIAACSVRMLRLHVTDQPLSDDEQAKVRRTDIATKLRMTYFRNDFLQVRLLVI